jgi:mannose-1-phosphate guanylyltransferase/mannose-1-phosphate guanylyltransferase/mannose-6-phosphate isomerase
MIIPVILAGGAGTRLWPLSRELYPKQFLPLVNGQTMLQNTALRLAGMEGVSDPIIICNENHRFLVAEQFRSINVKPACIILEPCGRNTAPAVTIAAMKALSVNDDAVLLVLPADHHIQNIDAFCEVAGEGALFAREGSLITFGIVPDSPETGYGYIKKGEICSVANGNMEAFRAKEFVEKPDRGRAESYVESGDYVWNSGMFMFLASKVLQEMKASAPEILAACSSAYKEGTSDLDFFRLDAKAFEACPSDSIDYAVMEKTADCLTLPLTVGWSDLGSWDALWEVKDKDENNNVTFGDVLIHDVRSSYIHGTSRLIAAIGVENHVVVETPDAVLISTWDRVQDIKVLVQKLKTGKREEALSHKKVFRPWGCYECINLENRFQVKRITVKPGAKLSLQRHYHRAEHWIVVHGTALVTRGDKQILLKEDESTYIPLGFDHRLENPGKIPLELIEVQSGSYLGEDDIVRFEDIYGRHADERIA